MSSIYVHIPFCSSICFYCDFCRILYQESIKDKWLDRLIREIHEKEISTIDTLYFGGGTPSILSEQDFRRLADCFTPYLNTDYEWTIECNPDSITEAKIKQYAKLGVNRISLGVQTFQDRLLNSIGRKHSSEDVERAIALFHTYRIHNISIDLIYGLPEQSLEDVKQDMDAFFELELDHLSIYSLQIEKNSVFGKKGIKPCDEDLEADMYELIRQMCLAHGFEQYEISSYARHRKYSRHNLSYWNDSDFIGLGCGAAGRENSIRYSNTSSISFYIKNGAQPVFEDESLDDKAFIAIMMALRTSFGLDLNSWNQKYKRDFQNRYFDVLSKWMPDYLVIENGFLKATEAGLEILNTILIDFMDVN